MKAVVYARYAENIGRGRTILERQVANQMQFAERHGYEVVKIYRDNGPNGNSLQRAGLTALRKDANGKMFEAVLVQDVPIFCRNAANLMKLIAEFKQLKVGLIFTEYPDSNIFQENN
jgi:DNA invertase Pin-like site-specific DNA recombinase